MSSELSRIEEEIRNYESLLNPYNSYELSYEDRRKISNELESLKRQRDRLIGSSGSSQPVLARNAPYQFSNAPTNTRAYSSSYGAPSVQPMSSFPSTGGYSSSYGAPNTGTYSSYGAPSAPNSGAPPPKEKSSWNFWEGRKQKKEKKEREEERFQREMLQIEQQRQERQRRNQAEQDALNQRIANTAKLSQQKNLESLWKHDQEMKEQLDDQSRREAERQRESEKETMEMERRIREETRRLEEERRLARDEEERKNSEWRRKKAQESYHQEQRTSEIISESQRSLDQQAAVNRQKHLDAEKNLNELNAQYSLEREAMLRELQQIEEEVKRSQEECRRKYEEWRRRSEEQLEEMVRLLKLAQWSRSIEENWSNRLKALKSTDRRVYRAMGQLRMRLAVAKVKELNVEFIRREMDRLKTEVSEVKTVMDREVKNLDDMHQFSGKQFVLDIANSLSDISTVCSELNRYLDSQHFVPKFGRPEASDFYERLEDFEQDFSSAYRKIPTISSLKSKYSSTFQSSSPSMQSITDDGHVIRIEEID